MRMELATSNFSSFLFSLLIFLLISEIQARRLQQVVCSSSCGDIKNISYPFRLKDDPAGCGPTGTGTFEFPKYYNLVYANFVRCSSKISDPTCRRLACLDGNQSYVYVKYGGYYIDDLPVSCSFISRVPMRKASMEYPPYEAIQKLLQSGFDLRWFLECRDCGSNPSKFSVAYHLLAAGIPVLVAYLFPISILVDYISNDCPVPYLPVIEYFISLELGAIIIARFIFVMVLVVFTIHGYIKTRKKVNNIIAITNHFRDKLGQGGFGSVCKGQLLNGSFIDVKVLGNSKFSGEEFINEVSTIGRILHANIVRLLGFYSKGSKRALVYEYMLNGSLDRHIFSKKENGQAFSWEKLHKITLGMARGIDYLHNGPHNILLDCNFIPKVADFGLAKFYPKVNDFICVSATRGTIGYIAPELISRNFSMVSSKSDVYSFGMLLLEMSGGRRNSFAKATRSSKAYFPSWVYSQIIEGKDLELRNGSEIESLIAKKLCIIGLWCIQVKPTDRPSITKVVEMLEGSIDDLQMPPKPFFSSPPRCNSIKEIQTDSSTEFLEYSNSIEECSFIDHINIA
ncbi:hypothetical protein ACOSP7_019702 [Xanthoceras sorbifolium]